MIKLLINNIYIFFLLLLYLFGFTDCTLIKLKDLITISIMDSILNYKEETKNIIIKTNILKYNIDCGDNYNTVSSNKIFYKICKPISNNQHIIKLNMNKKLKLDTSINNNSIK
jgi:hypothetical protein